MQGTPGGTPAGGDSHSPTREGAELKPPLNGVLSVSVEADSRGATLRLSGELDLSNVEHAKAGLAQASARPRPGALVIDLRELEFIDSSGISFLALALQDHGSDLGIRQSTAPAVQRVLEIVGLDREFARSAAGNGSPA